MVADIRADDNMRETIIPEYAIGIRAFRVHASDAFAQPRCFKNAIHGGKIGDWEYRDGKRIILWEWVTP